MCRGRVLAVDLDRTRVGILGGIGISLIGDFRSIEPLHNEIAIRDLPIESGPSIMRDVCQEIRRGNRDICHREIGIPMDKYSGKSKGKHRQDLSRQTTGTRGRGSQRVGVRHIGVFEYTELLPYGITIRDLPIGSESSI